MKYFNFDALIDKYSVDFTVISTGDGHYDDMGEWVTGTEKTTQMSGAIISLKEDKIYRSEGLLTSNDKQLFMVNPLPKGMIGSTVIYKGNKYKIQETVENSEFTGVWMYVLKHISAFNE